MKKIIISQSFGGLGDNLQFTTLPKLFNDRGYEIYISSNNAVRNAEIFDLVWGMNPYVKGVINENELATDDFILVGANMQCRWPVAEKNYYFMHRIEIAHGHNPTNLYPIIYYSPNKINEFSSYTVIDITGESQAFELKFQELRRHINNYISDNNINPYDVRVVHFKRINKSENIKYFSEYSTIEINNIQEYCDVLYSCKYYLTSNSGAHNLASAVKQNNETPDIICWNHWENWPECFEKGYYHYPNVKYITMKGLPQHGHPNLPILEAGTYPPLDI